MPEQGWEGEGSWIIRGLAAWTSPQAPQLQRSRTASYSLDKGMQQGRVAGTVRMEHGGGLAAQENK